MDKMEETEEQFVLKLIKTFQKYFKVEREVWSDCRNGRIDIILTTKENYRFGVECKRYDKKRGEKMGEFLKQAIRYSNYTFSGNKIPIFIAPPLSYKYFIMNEIEEIKEDGNMWHMDRHNENHEHHSFNGFLGAFNIGEIRSVKNDRPYFYFSTSNKIIWQSKKKWKENEEIGTHEVNYNNLIKKINK